MSVDLINVISVEISHRLNSGIILSQENSFRVFHGRGKCFPGLEGCVIDVFFPVVLVTAFDNYSDSFKLSLCDLLKSRLVEEGISAVLYQYRHGGGVENQVLFGAIPERFYATRGELKFNLSFSQQNVGYFLDIEPARHWLEKHVSGKKILNLFAYTCAFSVVSVAHGAEKVVNIDMSSRSLSVGRDNHKLNQLATENVVFLPHDIFKSWGKLKRLGPYDIVIVDPPSMQKGSFVESKDYDRVWRKMETLVNPGGYVLTCLNSPKVSVNDFKERAISALPGFELESVLPGSADFLEKQAEYALKMLLLKRMS